MAGSLAEACKKAKRTYIIGNGGSYANAVHICNDLISVGIRAYTLDPATLTAIGNDYGYENVFSRWLAVVGEDGDLLLALSGSGRSRNIINALVEAEKIGMETMLVTDFLKTRDMQESEEDQISFGHEAMRCLRNS
jgi:D-sedoheptulose 7-phosphate isomerase